MTATALRTCAGCGCGISARPTSQDTCGKLRCKRIIENERRRGILKAVVAGLREVEGADAASQDIKDFASEWLKTLAKAGVA